MFLLIAVVAQYFFQSQHLMMFFFLFSHFGCTFKRNFRNVYKMLLVIYLAKKKKKSDQTKQTFVALNHDAFQFQLTFRQHKEVFELHMRLKPYHLTSNFAHTRFRQNG